MPKPLLLECLLCRMKFSEEAITTGKYFLETCICLECYEKGQRLPADAWCFGKLPIRNSPGYSLENDACARLCPDRKVCSRFIKRIKE